MGEIDWEAVGIGILVSAILGAISLFLILATETPKGYTMVGENIAYKCDYNSILWYDTRNHKSLPTTLNDGRCHA